jgi:hypothetical protein
MFNPGFVRHFPAFSAQNGIRSVSKSTLERFEKLLPAGQVSEMIHELNQAAADAAHAEKRLCASIRFLPTPPCQSRHSLSR